MMRTMLYIGFLLCAVIAGINGECQYIQECPPPPTDISSTAYCKEYEAYFECAEPIIEECSDQDMPQLKREAFYTNKASQQERCHKKNERYCKKPECEVAPWPTGDPTGCSIQLTYLKCVKPYMDNCDTASTEEVYEYRYRKNRISSYCDQDTKEENVEACRKPVCKDVSWPTGNVEECPQQLAFLKCMSLYVTDCDRASSEEVHEYRYRERRVKLYCRQEEPRTRDYRHVTVDHTPHVPVITTEPPVNCDELPSCGHAPWTYRGPGDCSDLVTYLQCMTQYVRDCQEPYTYRYAKNISDRDCDGHEPKSTDAPNGKTTLPPECDKSSCGEMAWVIGTTEDCINQKRYVACMEGYMFHCPLVQKAELKRYNTRVRILQLYCTAVTTTTTTVATTEAPTPEPSTTTTTTSTTTTPVPTPAPTPKPTMAPTPEPTTPEPTTPKPTTAKPTTAKPTEAPTPEPTTKSPKTPKPTEAPTPEPTTESPTTHKPTEAPTAQPTPKPATLQPSTKTPLIISGDSSEEDGGDETNVIAYCVMNCDVPSSPLTSTEVCSVHMAYVRCLEDSHKKCESVTEQQRHELEALKVTVTSFCTPDACPDDFEERLVQCQSQIGLGVISAVRLAGLESAENVLELNIDFDDLTARCYPRAEKPFEDALKCTEVILNSCSDKKPISYLKQFVDLGRQRRAIKAFCDYREVMRRQLPCMAEKGKAVIPSYNSIVKRMHSDIMEIRKRDSQDFTAMTDVVCRYSEEAAFFTNTFFKDCGGNVDLLVKEILHADVPQACKVSPVKGAAVHPSPTFLTVLTISGLMLFLV